MADILISSSWGSDDPTQATLPFVGAQGFLDTGHDVGIVLLVFTEAGGQPGLGYSKQYPL